ncbi:MAG: flagellar biosynthesis protein FlhF [Bdellovibrionales bacterium]
MQVKKFEAKTMKEALEMVKNQLGPDAIILGAKDNNRAFGLLGKPSIEVTAAISEPVLHKKRFAESRLSPHQKDQLQRSSARVQKQFIEKSVDRYIKEEKTNYSFTSTPYIDIPDENVPAAAAPRGAKVRELLEHYADPTEMEAPRTIEQTPPRIKAVIRTASEAFQDTVQNVLGKSQASAPAAHSGLDAQEVHRLREEISGLKKYIQDLQNQPKTFVHTHPGAQLGLVYELSPMFERLTTAGLSTELVMGMLLQAQQELPAPQLKNMNFVEAWVAHHILNTIHVVKPATLEKVQVFVGPAGHGKTSSLVKFAGSLIARERKKVGIVSVGAFKVGTLDQIKIYANLLNVPLEVVREPNDWARVYQQFHHLDVILVDMPGLALKSEQEVALLRTLMPPHTLSRRIHFVGSVCSKDKDTSENVRRYLAVRPDDFIFTQLDESVSHGVIYNLQRQYNSPLFAFGTGPTIPDDFEFATKERLLDLIFKLTQNE